MRFGPAATPMQVLVGNVGVNQKFSRRAHKPGLAVESSRFAGNDFDDLVLY